MPKRFHEEPVTFDLELFGQFIRSKIDADALRVWNDIKQRKFPNGTEASETKVINSIASDSALTSLYKGYNETLFRSKKMKIEKKEAEMKLQEAQKKLQEAKELKELDALRRSVCRVIPVDKKKLFENAPYVTFRSPKDMSEFCRKNGIDDDVKLNILNVLGFLAESKVLMTETDSLLDYINSSNRGTLMNANVTLNNIPAVHGHFVKRSLFIRECYVKIAERIFDKGKKYPVCVTGDPGIGKSYFSLYMFFRLVEKKEKVCRIGIGGTALTFDGVSISLSLDGMNNSIFWRGNDTWLLLDGAAKEHYWDKKKMGIVFASPKGKNYHQFTKDNGLILTMPPWSRREIESYISQLGKIDKENLQQELSEIEGADLELSRMIYDRYNVVGGRIRLLLHPMKSLSHFRDELAYAVGIFVGKSHYQLCKMLESERSNEHSILFSVFPSRDEPSKDDGSQVIRFCSTEAAQMAVTYFLRKKANERKEFYRLTSENPNSGVLAGLILEVMFHNRLITFIKSSDATLTFYGFKLTLENGVPMQKKCTITFQRKLKGFKVLENDSVIIPLEDFHYFEDEPDPNSKGTLQLPVKADYDAVIAQSAALQVTASPYHHFYRARVKKLMTDFKLKAFIHVLLSHRAEDFRYQKPLTNSKNDAENGVEFSQYCLSFDV